MLKAALDKLWEEKQDFCLDVHFTPAKVPPYIRTHAPYTYDELERIFQDTDILAAPSIWNETFGYTVLEALSYGVPVIISGTVGAKDILVQGAGIVVEDITSEKLYQVFRELTAEKLRQMNEVIVEKQNIMTMEEMAGLIIDKCYGWIQGGCPSLAGRR